MKIKLVTAFATTTATFALSANAAVIIPVTGVLSSGFENYSGDNTKMTDGSGMNDNPNNIGPGQTGDPNNWYTSSNAYQREWQSDNKSDGVLYTPTSHNNKMGWVIFDLGSSQAMDEIHMWNVRNGQMTEVRNYTIHFSDIPLNLPGNNDVADYAFTDANGWSAFASDTMASTQTQGNGAEAILDVSGNSARYIGLEILTNNGNYIPDATNLTAKGRVGLAEFAVTAAVPEPSTTALLGLGGLALIFRRRK